MENELFIKYKALTETSPDCIKLFDPNGKLLYINPGGITEHNLGSLEEALAIGWNPLTTIIEEDQKIFKAGMEKALMGETSTIEIRHTDKGSNRDICLETIAPVKDKEGKIIGIFGVSRDITELKQKEAELEAIRNDLKEEVERQTEDLSEKIENLEKMNKIMIDRELKMVELKEKIKELENKNLDKEMS